MKRIVALLLLFTLLFSFFGCKKEPKIRLSEREELVYDALLVASSSFFNPSEMRILEIGDSTYVDTDSGAYECIKVRIQGENKLGGVTNDYYRLYLRRIEGKAYATWVVKQEATERWNECGEDEYPKSSYDSYEDYEEFLTEWYFEDKIFNTEEEKNDAIKKDARYMWDSSSYDEYPRNRYDSFDEYLDTQIKNSAWLSYWIIEDYEKDIPPSKDENFGKCEVIEDTDILESEEDVYRVPMINKALNDYWEERLGDAD